MSFYVNVQPVNSYLWTWISERGLQQASSFEFSASELKMPPRTPAVPIADLPGSIPTASIPDNIDHAEVAKTCVQCLSSLKPEDLIEDALWRDLLALTGTLRTFSTPKRIIDTWTELSSLRQPVTFTVTPNSSRIRRFGPKISFIAASKI